MSKIAIDIDNTICNTSDFFGPIAENYDRNVLHKNNVINYDKIVPRSDNWTKEELAYFVEKYYKDAIGRKNKFWHVYTIIAQKQKIVQ